MENHKSTLFLSIGICILLNLQIDTFGQTIFPTGTTIYNPDETYSSYILIADHTRVGNHPKAKVREAGAEIVPDDIRLIDMNGNVVHTWKVAPFFNKRCRLLPTGNLVYTGPNNTTTSTDGSHSHSSLSVNNSASHTHSVSNSGSHTHTANSRSIAHIHTLGNQGSGTAVTYAPAYYKMALIIKD